jgi:hypothetical protein
VTYAATYQTLTSNECDVCDVSFQLQSQLEKNDDEISLATPIAALDEISGSHASPCVTIESGTGFQPPQLCVTPASHTSPTIEPLKLGNQVVFTNPDNLASAHEFTLIQWVMDSDGSGDGLGDGSKGLSNEAFEQGDGLTRTSSEKIINEIEQLEVKQEPGIHNEVTCELSPLPEAPQNKGFDPSPHPSLVPSPNPSPPLTPDDELKIWEACCQSKPYPNPKSDNVRSSQKRALAIRQAYRAARTKEDLSALHREKGGEFSQDELTWVYNWLKIFFKAEFSHVQMTAKISQPGLL